MISIINLTKNELGCPFGGDSYITKSKSYKSCTKKN